MSIENIKASMDKIDKVVDEHGLAMANTILVQTLGLLKQNKVKATEENILTVSSLLHTCRQQVYNSFMELLQSISMQQSSEQINQEDEGSTSPIITNVDLEIN